MKKFFILLVSIIVFSLAYSDEIELLNSYWDFYSDNHNNYYAMGLGLSASADRGGVYLVEINPASVNIKYNEIYASMGFKSQAILIDTLLLSSKQPILNLGYARSIKKKINAGFYYNSTKNFKIHNKSELDNPYLLDKKLLFKETDYALFFNFVGLSKFKIGCTGLFKNYILDEETEYSYVNRLKKWQFVVKIGAIFIPIKNLNLGLTYSPSTKKDITVLASDDETYLYKTKVFPQKLSASLKYEISKFDFYYSFDYANTSADFYNLKDRFNHHTGIKYKLNNVVNFLGGFLTNFGYYSYESYDEIPQLPAIDNEYFVTGGINLKSDNFSFGISFMDSHITNATVPKTYISFGFSYQGETLF